MKSGPMVATHDGGHSRIFLWEKALKFGSNFQSWVAFTLCFGGRGERHPWVLSYVEMDLTSASHQLKRIKCRLILTTIFGLSVFQTQTL